MTSGAPVKLVVKGLFQGYSLQKTTQICVRLKERIHWKRFELYLSLLFEGLGSFGAAKRHRPTRRSIEGSGGSRALQAFRVLHRIQQPAKATVAAAVVIVFLDGALPTTTVAKVAVVFLDPFSLLKSKEPPPGR